MTTPNYYQQNKERIKLANKSWKQNNPDKVKAHNANYRMKRALRKAGVVTKYASPIPAETYMALMSKQSGSCAICFTTQPKGHGNKFHLDHNHVTGKIRGLLCVNCNHGLGKFKDSIDVLFQAARYLREND